MFYFGLAGNECGLIDPKGDPERFDNHPEADGMLRKLRKECKPIIGEIDHLRVGQTGAESDNREETRK